MCNLNMLCKVSDGSCACHSPDKIAKPIPIPVPLLNPQEGALVLSIFNLINQQKELIRKISEDSQTTNEKILKIRQKLNLKSTQIETTSEDTTNPDQLLKLLTNQPDSFQFTLQLLSDLPSPAYKEKPFSMLLQIVDHEEKRVCLEANTLFNIKLFTSENPPKAMKTSMSGDKVVRGTSEVEANSSVFFKNIVIKEVSSHFRGGWFYLVVFCKNSNVKPLIVPNFVVKARKLKPDETLKKKQKVECVKDS